MSRAENPRPKSHDHQGNTLVGVFLGLVIGVLIAAALAWYFSRPYEFQQSGSGQSQPVVDQSGAGGSGPIALPGKPGDSPVIRPPASAPVAVTSAPAAAAQSAPGEKKYDFYDILSKGDQASLPVPAPGKTDAGASDKFYLQLGAFADPSEADNIKARLALIGLEASVQRLETADKGTLHRVRVGPYLKPEDMNIVRGQLAQAGIDSTVVKIRTKASSAQSAPR